MRKIISREIMGALGTPQIIPLSIISSIIRRKKPNQLVWEVLLDANIYGSLL